MKATAQLGRPTIFGRERVLAVAIELFAVHGFAGASIRDIARAAGCSIANVYHHFANKEALWLAILDRSISDLPGRLRAAEATGTNPLDRFERLVRAHIGIADIYPREAQILFIGDERRSPEGNRASRALQRDVVAIYVAALAALADAGLARAGPIRMMALNVLGVVNWHLRWAAPDPAPDVRRRETDEIVRFVTAGIMGGPRADTAGEGR